MSLVIEIIFLLFVFFGYMSLLFYKWLDAVLRPACATDFSYSAVDWWTRKKQAEYVPVMSKDQASLKDFLKHYRILEVSRFSVVNKLTVVVCCCTVVVCCCTVDSLMKSAPTPFPPAPLTL